jgi:hypothetical protein
MFLPLHPQRWPKANHASGHHTPTPLVFKSTGITPNSGTAHIRQGGFSGAATAKQESLAIGAAVVQRHVVIQRSSAPPVYKPDSSSIRTFSQPNVGFSGRLANGLQSPNYIGPPARVPQNLHKQHVGGQLEKRAALPAPLAQLQNRLSPLMSARSPMRSPGQSGTVMQSKSASMEINSTPRMRSHTIQRVILALGDVAEAEHAKLKLSKQEYESRQVITEGAKRRQSVTRERQINPWDERNRLLLNFGPLDKIVATEPLRIYGHGQGYGEVGEIAMVGGYTPQSLKSKLIELGLPSTYGGEIYLTGCDTAVGPGCGFLGKFYLLIKQHCGNVTVRGNRGTATSLRSGEQGVWTGAIKKREYDSLRLTLVVTQEELLRKNRENIGKTMLLAEKNRALQEQRKKLDGQAKLESREVDEFLKQEQQQYVKVKRNSERAGEIKKQIDDIANSILELDAIAYDSSGKLSVKLPMNEMERLQQIEEIKAARLKAKIANIRRQVRDDLRENLMELYGWNRSHFWEHEQDGKFRELIKDRVLSRMQPTPSYIA